MTPIRHAAKVCPRCGNAHGPLEATPLPPTDPPRVPVAITHAARCPETGEEIGVWWLSMEGLPAMIEIGAVP